VLLAPTWSGESKRGEEVVAGLERLGTPLFTQLSSMKFQDLLALFDAQLVEGKHYFLRTRSLAALSTEAISQFIAAGNGRTSPHSVVFWHHSRGRATRIPVGATSFGIRAEHFMVEVICCWDLTSQTKGELHRQWAEDLSKALAPMALPGGFHHGQTSPQALSAAPRSLIFHECARAFRSRRQPHSLPRG
jgi:hypothetical protein